MKIIFLNCWNGRVGKPLFDFIKKESKTTDVFCFQEVSKMLRVKISKVLPNYSSIESHKNIGYRENYEISIFVSNKYKTLNSKINIIKDKKIGDCVTIQAEKFALCGVHGIAEPGEKLDTVERIKQSQEVINSVKEVKLPAIIGGDFNLLPNTKSVKMFEEAGYRNLIKDFNIQETRNRLAWEFFKDTPGYVQQHFADFCFVSKDIKVKSFEVPDIEISDHLPLILEFDI